MSCIENLLLKRYKCSLLLQLQAIGRNKAVCHLMRLNRILLLSDLDSHSDWRALEMPPLAEDLLLSAQLFQMLLRE